MRKLFFLAGLFLFFQGCTTSKTFVKPASLYEQLKNQIDFLLSDPSLQNGHVGIYIESLDNGRILYANNAFKLMVPASNMKLFTTATALVKLGPEFRFKTPVLYSGKIENGVLKGNLLVKGSGDPTISGRYFNGDRLAVFKSWADSLKAAGIQRVAGDLIGDDSFFKGARLGDGWNWDDETYWYSAQISALAFNDNCIDVAIWGAENAGQKAFVQTFPQTNYLKITSNVLTVDTVDAPLVSFVRQRGQNRLSVVGVVPVNADTLFESITVENPPYYFLQVLKEVLQQNGIKIEGRLRVLGRAVNSPEDSLQLLFTHQSPPLADIIKTVNKPSHNFYAEQLLKTLGATFKENGTFKAGCSVVREFLNSIGVPDQYFVNVDGSGLSRKNLVAPVATATLLRYMYHHPYFKIYYESLPIAGVDGTLKRRMRGTPAQGNVHAKTGYVRHMRALSGFVNLENDRPNMLFVMMFNNYDVPTPQINQIQDHICTLLSAFPWASQ